MYRVWKTTSACEAEKVRDLLTWPSTCITKLTTIDCRSRNTFSGRKVTERANSIHIYTTARVIRLIHAQSLTGTKIVHFFPSNSPKQLNIKEHLPWLWGSKDSQAYLSRVWACSGSNFWGGGCKGTHTEAVPLKCDDLQQLSCFNAWKCFAPL